VHLAAVEPPDDDPDRLAGEADRTVHRLRTMPLARLSAPQPGGASRAAGAFALAQQLADLAADLSASARRGLPPLPDSAAGDALAVCAQELLEQVRAAAPRPEARAACRAAVAGLIALRRTL